MASAGLLASKNYRRYFVGRIVSDVGDLIVPVALPFAVIIELDGSARQVGLVLAMETVPLIIFVLFGGVIADRLSPRLVMLATDFARAGAQLALAVVIFTGNLRLWHLLLAVFIQGAAQAAFHPAATRLLPAIIPRRQLQPANAMLSLSRNSARLVGPALAGVLIAIWGVGTAIAFDGVTFLVSAASLMLLPRRDDPRRDEGASMLREIRTGFREFMSRRWVWLTVVFFGAYQALALAPFLVIGPLIANEQLGGPGAWAIILTASGIGAIVGGALMLRFSPRHPLRFACLMTFLEPPFLIALGLVAPLPLIVVAATLAGMTGSIWVVLWNTALQEHIPESALGRVSAYDWFVSTAASPLCFAAAGFVAESLGNGATLAGAGVIMLATISLLLMVPEVRALGRSPADVPEPAPS